MAENKLLYIGGGNEFEVDDTPENRQKMEDKGYVQHVDFIDPRNPGQYLTVPVDKSTAMLKKGYKLPGVEVPQVSTTEEERLAAGSTLEQINRGLSQWERPIKSALTLGASEGIESFAKKYAPEGAKESIAKEEKLSEGHPTLQTITGLAAMPISPSAAAVAVKKIPQLAQLAEKASKAGIAIRTGWGAASGAVGGALDTGIQHLASGKGLEGLGSAMLTGAEVGLGLGTIGGAVSGAGTEAKGVEVEASAKPEAPAVRSPEKVERELGRATKEAQVSEATQQKIDQKAADTHAEIQRNEAKGKRQVELKKQLQQDDLAQVDADLNHLQQEKATIESPRPFTEKIQVLDAQREKLQMDLDDALTLQKDMARQNVPIKTQVTTFEPKPLQTPQEHIQFFDHKLDQLSDSAIASTNQYDAAKKLYVRQTYKQHKDRLQLQHDIQAKGNEAAEMHLDDITQSLEDIKTDPTKYALKEEMISQPQQISDGEFKKLINRETESLQQQKQHIRDYLDGKLDKETYEPKLPNLDPETKEYARQWNKQGKTEEIIMPGEDIDTRRLDNKVKSLQARIQLMDYNLDLLKKQPETAKAAVLQKLSQKEAKLNKQRAEIERQPIKEPESVTSKREALQYKMDKDRERLGATDQSVMADRVRELQQELGTSKEATKQYLDDLQKYMDSKKVSKEKQGEVVKLLTMMAPSWAKKAKVATKLVGMGGEATGDFLQRPQLIRYTSNLVNEYKQDKQKKEKGK